MLSWTSVNLHRALIVFQTLANFIPRRAIDPCSHSLTCLLEFSFQWIYPLKHQYAAHHWLPPTWVPVIPWSVALPLCPDMCSEFCQDLTCLQKKLWRADGSRVCWYWHLVLVFLSKGQQKFSKLSSGTMNLNNLQIFFNAGAKKNNDLIKSSPKKSFCWVHPNSRVCF